MKKLIALTAASVMASSAAVAGVILSGSASVSYAEATNAVTSPVSFTVSGTNGATSCICGPTLLSGTSDVSMASSIGPVSIDVDVDAATVSLGPDVLAGDVSIALDGAGKATVSTTVAGVAITHELGGATTAAATLAGMDVNVSRTATGTTTWDTSTTLNGVTLNSPKWTIWHDNGQIESEGSYLYSEREGKWIHWSIVMYSEREGKWTHWHDNGQIESEGNCVNGKQDGKWTIWHENGQKVFEVNHITTNDESLWRKLRVYKFFPASACFEALQTFE